MTTRPAVIEWIAICAWTSTSACTQPGHAEPSDHPAASALRAAAPSAPREPPKPWFSGAFGGSYEAKRATVEIKTGAVREWAADDGKASSGPGTLTLTIDDRGLVLGASDGALGSSHVAGQVEGDTLRAVLTPDQSSGLRGVLIADRDRDDFRGSITASSGDSLRVRQAPVELKKKPLSAA